MVSKSDFAVPANISFEAAIALTQDLLAAWEMATLAPDQVQHTVSELVQSQNGARGFFVTYLSDDRVLADTPSPAVLVALRAAPEIIAPLLVKNLAMSTAMAIAHARNQTPELVAGSARVQSRSLALIRALELPQVQTQLRQLHTSLEQGTGDYAAFLRRWGYDDVQKQAILTALQPVLENADA